MNRDSIVNWLILFYGILAGVAAFILICGLVFGWVPVPEAARTEFWRLVILVLVAAAPLITNELRERRSRRLEQKVEETLHEVSNGLPKRIAEELQPVRDPSDRTRSGDALEAP